MNHIMAVFDEEENYAVKLVDYLNLKEEFPFEAVYFKSIDKMREFSNRQKLDIALVGEDHIDSILEFMPNEQLIILSKNGVQYEESRKSIYKYQSCENVIREILTMMAESNSGNKMVARKNNLQIIGFYSPIKRIRQTTSALIMGELLSRKDRTLYLNMESNSGLMDTLHLQFRKDMSDLLYHIQNGKSGIQYLLGGMTEKRNGLDMLPPMMCQLDLISIQKEDWITLFSELEKYSDYKYLILDISDGIQGLYEILRQCSRIYTLIETDETAKAKLMQYEKTLQISQYEDIIVKTRKCSLPEREKNTLDYYKAIIQEDFNV